MHQDRAETHRQRHRLFEECSHSLLPCSTSFALAPCTIEYKVAEAIQGRSQKAKGDRFDGLVQA